MYGGLVSEFSGRRHGLGGRTARQDMVRFCGSGIPDAMTRSMVLILITSIGKMADRRDFAFMTDLQNFEVGGLVRLLSRELSQTACLRRRAESTGTYVLL